MKMQDRHHHRRKKVQSLLHEISFYLELVIALLVIVIILCSVIGLCMDMIGNAAQLLDPDRFTHFLALALNIVVGIEFLKMLCRHNMDAVIEVLLFTLARHLIVNQHSMIEGLLCIVAIALLFVVRKYLFIPKLDSSPDEAEPDSDQPEVKE